MRLLLAALLLGLWMVPAWAEVITRLPTQDKVVALTFDGCEGTGKPAWLDHALVDVLQREQVPFTIFAGGLFAQRNHDDLVQLTQSPLVEVENHSFSHPQHMERLTPDQIRQQVMQADDAIAAVTGKRPQFFRFPAGNYDEASLRVVEATGHKVVHWRFPSGDPAKSLSPARLSAWVLENTRPGDILIFHINGRAPASSIALPDILAGLRAKGYRFVRLDQML